MVTLNLRLPVELIVKISLSTILLPVGDLRRVQETRSFRVGGARVRALAFYFLAQSLKYIPLGVAYAIW